MAHPDLRNLISELEGSVISKDVDTNALLRRLAPADAMLELNPVVEPAVNQQAVSVLCSWLRAHEDLLNEICMCMVVKIISKLLGQDPATDNIAIQKGLLSSVTALLTKRGRNVTMVRSCLEVLATLSVVENSDTIISRLGSVPVVIDLLKMHREKPAVLEDAITTLALMAKRTRHRRAISQSGGISELVEILKQYISTPSLVVAVCRFLSNFAVKEECCLTVLQNGGVEALISAFDQLGGPGLQGGLDLADTRATVASAIWVCSMDCGEVQHTLLASGWVPSLAAVLKANPRHAGLHEATLGIVRGLCRHKSYREEIMTLGFIPAAIHAMKTFPDNLVLLKEACGIFGNLATDPDIREKLGEMGILQQVVSALAKCHVHDERKVAKLALGALMNLSSCEANRNILATTEVVPVILGAARNFMNNENILDYAIGVISHLAVQDSACQQLTEAGGVEALLLFLEEHPEDLQVVSRSLVALRRLLKHTLATGSQSAWAAVLTQIATAGQQEGASGIKLLIDTMQAHVYDETVVKEAALLLASLSKAQNNIPALMQLAVQPCMKALEVHQNDAPVADALGGLLGVLPLEDDDSFSKGESTPKTAELMGIGATRPQMPAIRPFAKVTATPTSGGYPIG